MLRKLFLAVLLCSAFGLSARDAYSVVGAAVDSLGEGAAFATVRVYSATDSVKPVTLGAADVDGRFELPLKAVGEYRAVISAVGAAPLSRSFQVSARAPKADLGTLNLKPDNTLGEVTVTAAKPLVSKEIDRIGYDVASDPDASTSTVLEMLKKVPLVTVDPDGTIKVKGSSDFRVYRNGRPNKSYATNAKEIFRGLPASAITKIEVITDPGAREDAEGVGAILNIVTTSAVKMSGAMGYLGVSESTSSQLPNVWAGMTAQYDKLTLSTNAGFWGSTEGGSHSRSVTDYTYDATSNRIRTETENWSKPRSTWWGLDLSFELDSLNLFTMEYGGNYYSDSNREERITQMWLPDGSDDYSFRARSNGSNSSLSNYIGVNYQRSTRRKGEAITLSYQGSYGTGKPRGNTEYYDMVNVPVDYTASRSRQDASMQEHTAQIDWSRPYGEMFTLDLGGKYIYRNSHDKSTILYEGDDTNLTDFRHESSVAAGYADLRARIKRVSLRAGLRYEYTHMHGHYTLPSDLDNINADLNDWVPQASVMWSPNDANSIKASYSMTIQRPGIEYLSPTVNKTPTSVSTGNPWLKSAKYHSAQMNYSLNLAKVSVDATLYYGHSNDALIATSETRGNVVYNSYANNGRHRNVGFSAYTMWQPTDKTQLTFNGGVRYVDYKYPVSSELTLQKSGWAGNVWMRITQRLPWNLRASGSLSYWGGYLGSVYTSSTPSGNGSIDHSFDLQRSFLKDRLNVNLTVQNPFGPYHWQMRRKNFNNGMTGASVNYYGRNCTFMVSVNWTFGSLNAQVKKTKGQINNTDLQGSGTQSGSQGSGK